MDNKRILKIIAILVVAISCITFFNYTDNKPGTAEEVLKANVGWSYESFSKIYDIIEVNDKGDALCVFETDSKIAVAYLNCIAANKYKYGIATEFSQYFSKTNEYEISCIRAGDSDLEIKYVITYNDVKIADSKEEYNYQINDSSVTLHILSVEDYKCSGYECQLLIQD